MTNFTDDTGKTIDFFQIDIREFSEQTVCSLLRFYILNLGLTFF